MRILWKEGAIFAYLADCQGWANLAVTKGALFAFVRWVVPVKIIVVVTNTRIVFSDKIFEDKIRRLVAETFVIYEQKFVPQSQDEEFPNPHTHELFSRTQFSRHIHLLFTWMKLSIWSILWKSNKRNYYVVLLNFRFHFAHYYSISSKSTISRKEKKISIRCSIS